MQETVKAREYLDILCGVRPDRRAGSPGNREATDFFSAMVNKWNYHVDATPFPCLDHEIGRASMTSQEREHQVFISPFSLGCEVTSELVTINTMIDLESCRCAANLRPFNFGSQFQRSAGLFICAGYSGNSWSSIVGRRS